MTTRADAVSDLYVVADSVLEPALSWLAAELGSLAELSEPERQVVYTTAVSALRETVVNKNQPGASRRAACGQVDRSAYRG